MANQDDPLEAERAGAVAYVRFAAEETGYFRLVSDPSVLADSPRLQAMNEARWAQMEQVLGRNQPAPRAPRWSRGSAGMLAAQALVYGLACMITDGSLGAITAEEAERLAYEVTGVLGEDCVESSDDVGTVARVSGRQWPEIEAKILCSPA